MISEYSGRPAESGVASIACSKAVGDLRLGVLGDADPVLRTVALAIVAFLRIPMIPYTQSDVFGRGRRRPRSGRRLGAYPVSSPPSRCLIDSLQALELAVERVMIRLDFAQGKWFHSAVHGLSSTGVGPSLARPA
jgi:hypothetical protein